MSETKPATYRANGEPADLAAAAQDALEWLSMWRDMRDVRLHDEDCVRLGRCIAALEEFLRPQLPHVFEPACEDVVGGSVAAEGQRKES